MCHVHSNNSNNNNNLTITQSGRLQRSLLVLGYICENIKKCNNEFIKFCETKKGNYKYRNNNNSSNNNNNNNNDSNNNSSNRNNRNNKNSSSNNNSTENNNNNDSLPLNEVVANHDIRDIDKLYPEIIYGACYSAIRYALTIPNTDVQLRCAQALCGIFTGYYYYYYYYILTEIINNQNAVILL